MTLYYAHSSPKSDKSDWQPLSEHLKNVGEIAANCAAHFLAHEIAQVAGLLHDLGKYSAEFQSRLEGNPTRADHATAGAQLAVKRYGVMGKLIAFAVAGHHAGLANGIDSGDARSSLDMRLKLQPSKDIPNINSIWESEISLPMAIAMPQLKSHSTQAGFQCAFFARMIFSCLIDADRTDTQNYVQSLESRPVPQTIYPTLEALRTQLDSHLNTVTAKAMTSELNLLRARILAHSRRQAALPPGLFSMTVPTGGGKTLTSMAFALDHALEYDQRRVIYVIPFTSIIEQNARVFKDAFGDLSHGVIEHHSAFDRDADLKLDKSNSKAHYSDKLRTAMESWDAPVIVTTAVQFFESLFSDRPSQCRKLHNIANSVIVLDEAQTLPLKLLRPVMAAIDELARNYKCTIVLCTATQPALREDQGFFNGFQNVREIAPEPEKLFEQLKRTKVHAIGTQSDEQLVDCLRKHSQVLMIVNNRRHARSLYDAIKDEAGAYHLSTLMIAKHRSKVLEEVRQKLIAGEPCKLISTSLIEAGVDVDFPVLYRAEAGLDSIAQAAGRCNREGKRLLDESIVSVFQSPDWTAPPELAQLAGNMRMVMRNHAGDVLAPEAMSLYFKHVYSGRGEELDAKKLLPMHNDHARNLSFPFQNIAKAFSMIESHLQPVIVPLDDTANRLVQSLRFADKVGGIARQLQPYLVQIPKTGFEALRKAGAISVIAPDKFGTQFWMLENMDLYADDAGLSWENPTFMDAEKTVL
ncbi:MAG: CRISPR-associated helicase Cas3' [Cytophagales bacterium]|nr:CRISPR-associated helicase Cas3' [Cytophagales bacterium]